MKQSASAVSLPERRAVVSASSSAHAAAGLFAQLVQLPHVKLTSIDELGDLHGVDTVVTDNAHLTAEFFLALRSAARKQAWQPGLIAGADEASLEATALRIAARRTDCTKKRPRSGSSFILSHVAFGNRERREGHFLGNAASGPEIRKALIANSDILTVLTHANFTSVALADETRICAALDRTSSAAADQLSCMRANQCYKLPGKPRITEALHSNALVSPGEIKAQIFLLFACSVLRCRDDIIPLQINLGSALCASETIGVTVTTWKPELVIDDPAIFGSLINNLSRGHDVGHSVHAFNELPTSLSEGLQLVILGDARFALTPGNIPPIPERSAEPLLTGSSVPSGSSMWEATCQRLTQSAKEYAQAVDPLAHKPRLDGYSQLGPTDGWAEALQNIAAYRYPEQLLERHTVLERKSTRRSCIFCGGIAWSYPVRLDKMSDPLMHATYCPLCGVSEYASIKHSVGPDFSNLRDGWLAGRWRDASGRALVRVSSSLVEAEGSEYVAIVLDWPQANNALADRCPLPKNLPDGPLRCLVYYLDAEGLSFWGGRFQRNWIAAQ